MNFLLEFQQHLPVYQRFVDNIFEIWIPHQDSVVDIEQWRSFKTEVNSFYSLEWIFVEPCEEVDLWISN